MQIEGFVDNTEAASIFELYLLEVDIDLISKYTKIYRYTNIVELTVNSFDNSILVDF